jgi:hypothetical protein
MGTWRFPYPLRNPPTPPHEGTPRMGYPRTK